MPTDIPHHLADHPYNRALGLLVEAIESKEITGNALVAVARLLLQDRWHLEEMAQREAHHKEKLAHQAQVLELRRQALKATKKAAKARVQKAQERTQAKAEKEAQKEAQKEAANAPLPPLKFTFKAVEPSTAQQDMARKLGIQPGGVFRDSRRESPTATAKPNGP